MIFIVMGVAGSGKTTIGGFLAERLELPFYDADDFHPSENIRKMLSSIPLCDTDRVPWLNGLAQSMAVWDKDGGAVLACSALKEQYRAILSKNTPVQFIYLKASKELIRTRFSERRNHFMPSTLIDSQFEALEKPEAVIAVDASQEPERIVDNLLKILEFKQ